MHRSLLAFSVGFALLAALPAGASDILRSVDPSGRVIYSDRVISGAQITERMPMTRMSADETRASIERANNLARAGAAFNQRHFDRIDAFSRADWELRDAQARIAIAERELLSAEVPLPGEVRGLRGGGARLTEEYWARQSEIRIELDRAEAARDQARARMNTTR